MSQKIFTYESDPGGFNTKNCYFDNGEEAVVFDAQFTPDIAKKSLEEFKSQSTSPVKFLVITHPSPDKFNGSPVYKQAGAQVVASEDTQKALEGVHAYKKYYFV